MKQFTVSVCIITYNQEQYIEQAIESVLMQQTNFEFELIIGEDCSNDSTRSICEKYANKSKIIKLLPSDKNLGIMPNFIRTLQAGQGKYTAICEGDDYWTDPYKLQKQVDFLESNPDYAGTAHQSLVIGDGIDDRVFRKNVPNEISLNDLLGLRLFHTASVVFRSSINSLFKEAPHVLSGDRLLNFFIVFSGKIRFFDDNMCVYRLHSAGISSNATFKQTLSDLKSIPYLKKIYPPFPVIPYLSYIYLELSLCKDATIFQKLYYRFLSIICSAFSKRRN